MLKNKNFYKTAVNDFLKKINFKKRINYNFSSCDICDQKNFTIITSKSLLSSDQNLYCYLPVVNCLSCGHSQQLIKFDKKFYSLYYSKYIEKNILTKKNIKKRYLNSIKRGAVLKSFLERRLKSNFDNKKILDVGCGYGGMLYPFAKKGSKTFGIDPDKNAIDYGKKHNKLTKLQSIEAESMKFKKKYFDLIIINGSLEHVYDMNIVLQKVSSYLKNNGILFLEGKGYPLDIIENFFNFNHHRIFTKKTFDNVGIKYNIKSIYSSYNSQLSDLKSIFAHSHQKNYKLLKKNYKKNKKGNLIWLGKKQNLRAKTKYKKDHFIIKHYKLNNFIKLNHKK